MTRRQGRGRLSAIDLLPSLADEAIEWAYAELRAQKRTQLDIHAEFNQRLAEIGLGPVSYSAFNRHSIRLAGMARRQEEVRAITASLVERLDPGDSDDLAIAAAETLKTIIYELMEGEVTPKQSLELGRALQAAQTASQMPLARKREMQAKFAQQVDEAIEKVAKTEKGLTDEQAAFFRREVLGVKQ